MRKGKTSEKENNKRAALFFTFTTRDPVIAILFKAGGPLLVFLFGLALLRDYSSTSRGL